MYNLDKLLDEVIENYDIPKNYHRPSIGWSSENMNSAFGRYDYWVNKIVISRLLNAKQISKKAILSVIFHELWHQEITDHTEEFEKKLKKFPNYKILERELNHFYEKEIELAPVPKTTKHKIDFEQAIFCLVPYETGEDYLDAFQFYNHYFYVNIGESKNIDKRYTAIINPAIIWVAKNKSKFHVIGWSIRNEIFEKQKRIRHELFGGYDLDYQIKTKNEGFYILPAKNCNCTFTKSKLPKYFEEQGICHINEISNISAQKTVNFIETYNCEFLPIGLTDVVIEACSPFIEKDSELIIEKSIEAQNNPLRTLCLTNLAVKQEPCIYTYFYQAEALRGAGFFDEAAVAFEKVHRMYPTDIQIIGLCINVNVILGNIEKARDYLPLLSDEDIETLEIDWIRNSIVALKKNEVENNLL